eukprot:c25825_g1_i1.p1 GENE.c25825_g1_i1~~c25825_g1_i1.p1  ORF type:complete len:693 (+),score=141.58 c25825_g1_i1:108-2081(+)
MFRQRMMSLAMVAFAIVACCCQASQPIVLPPTTNTSSLPDISLVWIQGALVPNERYLPLMTRLQQTCTDFRIWIGIPSLPLNTPTPVTIGGGINDVLKTMKAQGMENTINFYGGHSLGTVMLQDYITGHPELNTSAQILAGGYILRKHYYPSFSYPFPTLTIGGELDGLARVTRTIAESMYNILNVTSSPSSSSPRNGDVSPSTFPVIMVPGMNHWQFASGNQTSWVRTHDLDAEITFDDAYNTVSSHLCDYIQYIASTHVMQKTKKPQQPSRLSPASRRLAAEIIADQAQKRLESAVKDTKDFIAPVIDAYLLEGSRHYNAKDQFGGPGQSTCVKGLCDGVSEWSKVAQQIIAGTVPGFDVVSPSNFYVQLSASPVSGGDFHLPHISPNNVTRVVNVTTYSQGSWPKEDNSDNGIAFTSASELSVKLASRQCILINSTFNDSIPFSVDDPSFCRETNEQAYAKALQNAGDKTLKRYQTIGEPLVFADDVQKGGGPSFIESALQFNNANTTTANGTVVPAIQVVAPACKTEADYWNKHFPFPRPSWIPDPGCYHYCKLLSPARAMEWVYVDGLRLAASNSTQCTSCVADTSKIWCWVDGQCHAASDGSDVNPCAGDSGKSWCVSESGTQTGCMCSSCWDASCAHDARVMALTEDMIM